MSTWYLIPKDDDIIHYGVKNMRWRHRKQKQKKQNKARTYNSKRVMEVWDSIRKYENLINTNKYNTVANGNALRVVITKLKSLPPPERSEALRHFFNTSYQGPTKAHVIGAIRSNIGEKTYQQWIKDMRVYTPNYPKTINSKTYNYW